jgi:hypothetical protein
MTRTEKLAEEIRKIAIKRTPEMAQDLIFRGPRGGRNAARIYGWHCTGNSTISKAARMAGNLPMMNWWHGSAPTPSKAIPECCAGEIIDAYNRIFEGRE